MKIKIVQSEETHWYHNAIGKVFEVLLTTHPTFGYKTFILKDTEENRRYFELIKDKDERELSLLFLKDGFTGVKFENAEIVS